MAEDKYTPFPCKCCTHSYSFNHMVGRNKGALEWSARSRPIIFDICELFGSLIGLN